MGVGLRLGCVLSLFLFIVYMKWIDKCSQADECATIGNRKISYLLFTDDLVLLSSSESGLQRALNSCADACNIAGMKVSPAKTEILHLSRNPDQCVLHRGGVEDTRLEAKAKDTKKIQSQGQGQPFRRQTLSRPRTGMLEAKDQEHRRKCSPKKKSSKIFFRRSPIIGVPRIFDWGGLNHKSHAMTSSKFFQRGSFCGAKIS